MDIKNIINLGSKSHIYKLLNMKNTKISRYHLEVIGEFDKEKHEEFLKENAYDWGDFDTKLFFRLCPFATTEGCSIDFNLRPHPCNLYLCREVISSCGENYKEFSKERRDYFSYCNYFSDSLKYTLMDNNVDLLSDPFKAIEIIEQTDIPNFSFKILPPILFNDAPYNNDIVAG